MTEEHIIRAIDDHLATIHAFRGMASSLAEIADAMVEQVVAGAQVLWLGNGGSAADAQHFAAELVGRFERERDPIPSIALTTDTSVLTSVSNDYGFRSVFRRQVEALCRPGDVVVGISTSGTSRNVNAAMKAAREREALTVGLTGRGGGELVELCDHTLIVPSNNTARIQEVHELIGHILCDCMEEAMTGDAK